MMRNSTRAQAFGLLAWLALTFVAAALGAVASMDAAVFYAQLSKPAWAPPGALFGPVWLALYLLMGLAAWLVWRQRPSLSVDGALGLYLVQLAANALWSWLFFAWHRGALAFADILVLWMMILATTIAFARIRQVSAWLLVPYLAWVSFATALNYSVWQRNPPLL